MVCHGAVVVDVGVCADEERLSDLHPGPGVWPAGAGQGPRPQCQG